ncbi:MAG TPA: NrfD/PsrC family molybdoenzyme membrane anchor subunit [Planctomycetota bacterium]|nr:NrfD/PsrC family molybdoenzyme membrane anchor subunit [Planctomycetota bacterium]
MPQHFVAPPEWGWYIVWYFFLGGISGGAYVLGTLLRLSGDRRDQPMARLAFLLSFPAMAVCPLLLTLDLGQPMRFWHMLWNSADGGPTFKYWSPMSVGSWVLVLFSLFTTISFVDALAPQGWLRGAFGRLFHIAGALLGLALAGYTGVLLSVSNQPVWSDTWALGGLFLASGLSVATAALALLAAGRRTEPTTAGKLWRVDGWFLLLELALLVVFVVSLGSVARRFTQGPWWILWLLVLAGNLVPLALHLRTAAARGAIASILVLVGGLALRVAVVFGAQA